jgi:group I intron endonuclease
MLRLARNDSLPSWIIDWDMPEPGMKHFVYKITNLITDEYYIGQHTHSSSCNRNDICRYITGGVRIKRSIKKYGAENFSKEILVWCCSHEELNEEEALRIDLDDPLCLNLIPGGIGSMANNQTGHKVSEETRRKISESNKGKSPSVETRAKISAASKGRSHTPETRERIAAKQRGRTKTDEEKARNSAAQKLKAPATDETRAKISKALRGKPHSEEHTRNAAAAKVGFIHTEESKAKMRKPRTSEQRENVRRAAQLRALRQQLSKLTS